MLKTRVLSSLVFTPFVVGCILAGGAYTQGLVVLVSQLCLWEFLRLTQLRSSSALGVTAHLAGLGGALCECGLLPAPAGIAPAALTFLALACAALKNPLPLATSLDRLGRAYLGVAWTCFLLPPLAVLRARPHDGVWVALVAVLGTWAADTGAYFAGRAFGKTPLYPMVSPKKTLEGGFGGVALAALVAGFLFDLGHVARAWPLGLTLGCCAAVAGTLGDLAESLLKRSVGAKDSSQLIPGHGGVFDRFDGILFAVPVVNAAVACFDF